MRPGDVFSMARASGDILGRSKKRGRGRRKQGGLGPEKEKRVFFFSGWNTVDGRNPTPWKINMEPTNHPFRKENDLPNLHEDMFHVNLPGCTPPGDSIPDLT